MKTLTIQTHTHTHTHIEACTHTDVTQYLSLTTYEAGEH